MKGQMACSGALHGRGNDIARLIVIKTICICTVFVGVSYKEYNIDEPRQIGLFLYVLNEVTNWTTVGEDVVLIYHAFQWLYKTASCQSDTGVPIFF